MTELEVSRVSKRFAARRGDGVVALDEVSFEMPRGQFVSIVGPSGCGKSTLLMLIAGLEDYTTGVIRFKGQAVTDPSRERGVVFQDYSLYPWLTVRRNVSFPLVNQPGLSRRQCDELVGDQLQMVGLADFADAYPAQLSGGMRQRVALARALAVRPRLLLMDEPFGALDAQTRALMQELLTGVWEQHRMTVVFITHDIEEAAFLSDRVLLMTARPGRIKDDVEIQLPRPRTFDLMASPEMLDYKSRLLVSIREEALKTAESGLGPAAEERGGTGPSARAPRLQR